ncbi:hypothetical protein K438DRAFT_1839235 [Mycena galopus ATCC 62051]|nr:hypothetical protein K438DRAFT_1839235 [Mycena galopus ATCC 62051]
MRRFCTPSRPSNLVLPLILAPQMLLSARPSQDVKAPRLQDQPQSSSGTSTSSALVSMTSSFKTSIFKRVDQLGLGRRACAEHAKLVAIVEDLLHQVQLHSNIEEPAHVASYLHSIRQ